MTDPLEQPSRYQQATDQANAYLNDHTLQYSNEALRWMVQGLTLMPPDALQNLSAWLKHHELDIAEPMTWDDHAMLAQAFTAIIGRPPKA